MDRRLLWTLAMASAAFVAVGLAELYSLNFRTDVCTFLRQPCFMRPVSVHFFPALYAFSPLCNAFGSCLPVVATLTVLQGVALGASVAVVYLIGKELLGARGGTLLAAIYALSPLLHGTASFDVHVESFMVFFLGLMYYLLIVKDNTLGYVFGLIALMFKETALFPLLGTMLYRFATKKFRLGDKVLLLVVVLSLFVITVYMVEVGGWRNWRFLAQRYFIFSHLEGAETTFEDILGPRKLTYLMFLFVLYPFSVLALAGVEFLLFLPTLVNLLLMSERLISVRFGFGYQYGALHDLMLTMITALTLKKVAGERGALQPLKYNLIIIAVAFLIFSPITPLTLLSIYFSYYSGIFLPPAYFAMPFTAYRPPVFAQAQCLDAGMRLFDATKELIPSNYTISVNDPIAPLFCCRYKITWTGDLVYNSWRQLGEMDMKTYLVKALYKRATRSGHADALIVARGLENTVVIPNFLLDKLGLKRIADVKGAGSIYLPEPMYWQRIKEFVKEVNDDEWGALLIHDNTTKRIYSLYTFVPPKSKVVAWFYVDFNGTYAFYVSPTIKRVEIDNTAFVPDFNKRELMRDRWWGVWVADLELEEGWHRIELVVETGGMFAVYVKGPYSCAPQPLSSGRPPPNNCARKRSGGEERAS